MTKTDEDSSVWKGLGQKKRKILPRDRIQSKRKIFSMWKGLRQRKRKQIIPNGRAKDRERRRFFHVEGPQTVKEEDYSTWKGHRQKKRKIIPCGRAKDRQK